MAIVLETCVDTLSLSPFFSPGGGVLNITGCNSSLCGVHLFRLLSLVVGRHPVDVCILYPALILLLLIDQLAPTENVCIWKMKITQTKDKKEHPIVEYCHGSPSPLVASFADWWSVVAYSWCISPLGPAGHLIRMCSFWWLCFLPSPDPCAFLCTLCPWSLLYAPPSFIFWQAHWSLLHLFCMMFRPRSHNYKWWSNSGQEACQRQSPTTVISSWQFEGGGLARARLRLFFFPHCVQFEGCCQAFGAPPPKKNWGPPWKLNQNFDRKWVRSASVSQTTGHGQVIVHQNLDLCTGSTV